jgi:hypothetical protein
LHHRAEVDLPGNLVVVIHAETVVSRDASEYAQSHDAALRRPEEWTLKAAMAMEITRYQEAEIIGISDRHLRLWRERYNTFDYDGSFDRRRGQPSPRGFRS